MTTTNIRTAAQALLGAFNSRYLEECDDEIEVLRAALAEPAAATPEDDVVPVVATEYVCKRPGKSCVYASVDDTGRGHYGEQWDSVQMHPLVRQRDHLAAMEVMRQELAQAKALSVTHIMLEVVPGDGSGYEVFAQSVAEVEDLITKLWERADNAELLLAQVKADHETDPSPDFSHWMADNVMELQHESYPAADVEAMRDRLLHECWAAAIASDRANRSVQVVKVMRLVDEFAEASAESRAGVWFGPDYMMPHVRLKSAIKTAVCKMAGDGPDDTLDPVVVTLPRRGEGKTMRQIWDEIAWAAYSKAWPEAVAGMCAPARGQRMREAGFTRRPSLRELPSDGPDEEDANPTEAQEL